MRRFVYKFLLFIALVSVLQFFANVVYTRFYEPIRKVRILLEEKRADIVIFGDSVLSTRGPSDTDMRDIAQMLQAELPDLRVGALNHPAYSLDVFYSYIDHISRLETRLRLIIVPINPRSFSSRWEKEPRWQFVKEKIYLEGNLLSWLYRPLKVFKYEFNSATREKLEESPVFKGREFVGVARDFLAEGDDAGDNMRNRIIYQYMADLDPRHRKLMALERILGILEEEDLVALFYVTPVDYQTCSEYLPGEFREIFGRNIDLMRTMIAGCGNAAFIDMSFDLPTENFVWSRYPDEHLNAGGRHHIAARLAERVRDMGL